MVWVFHVARENIFISAGRAMLCARAGRERWMHWKCLHKRASGVGGGEMEKRRWDDFVSCVAGIWREFMIEDELWWASWEIFEGFSWSEIDVGMNCTRRLDSHLFPERNYVNLSYNHAQCGCHRWIWWKFYCSSCGFECFHEIDSLSGFNVERNSHHKENERKYLKKCP
jgi:hypothetical protein